MHNPDDAAQMTWFIQCANPVIPEDWEVVFDPFQHVTTYFNISFKINKEAILPTQPIIRLIALTGDQRIDNDIEFDNATVYPFATLDNAGKLPSDFPDPSGCVDFYTLEKMGVDPDSGWMSDGVMKSDSAKKMGVYGEKFTIYVPVQNHPDFTEGKYLRLFD